jgi:hypothetical protein
VGPRYRHSFNEWGSVYAKLEGIMALTTLDLSTSLSEEDPISQTKTMSPSFGGSLALGAMGSIVLQEKMPDLLMSFEFGYALQSSASYEKIGSLDLSGLYSSLGVGLRF